MGVTNPPFPFWHLHAGRLYITPPSGGPVSALYLYGRTALAGPVTTGAQCNVYGGDAGVASVGNSQGGMLYLRGGGAQAAAGVSQGGDVVIIGGNGVTKKGAVRFTGAQIFMGSLPIADPGVSGQLWNSAGTVKISP